MHADVYGLPTLPGMAENGPPWFDRWVRRSPEEWSALGAKYGFRYVLAPSSTSLKLPLVASDDTEALYELPKQPGQGE
jgi:hypothetical protein